MFEWLGLRWCRSIPPATYIPFISQLNEDELLGEVRAARTCGQLRLLVETVANADILLGDALQRIDVSWVPESTLKSEGSAKIPLLSWHSYSRPEVHEFEKALETWRPAKKQAIFMPCGRERPYAKSATHRRLLRKLAAWGIDREEFDLIVITSLGPVPESLWDHDAVMRYDTGVRDIYRMLILMRRMLAQAPPYRQALDCLGFRPYRDLLAILQREGLIAELRRPATIRGRNIPAYKVPGRKWAV